MVKNVGWTTTSVPIDLAERVESFVNSKEGKKLGYTSKTGFIADAIREKIDELDGNSKKQQDDIKDEIHRLHYVVGNLQNSFDQLIEREPTKKKIKDLFASRISKLEIINFDNIHTMVNDTVQNEIAMLIKTDQGYFCNLCETNKCIHVRFASLSVVDSKN